MSEILLKVAVYIINQTNQLYNSLRKTSRFHARFSLYFLIFYYDLCYMVFCTPWHIAFYYVVPPNFASRYWKERSSLILKSIIVSIYSYILALFHSRCNDCRINCYINFTFNNHCVNPNKFVYIIDMSLSPYTKCYSSCLYRFIMPHSNLSTTMDGIYWIYEKISVS